MNSQILMNLAVQVEDASRVSILKSTDLLFIFLLQYFILGIHSNLSNTLGAILIFLGALLVMIYKIIDKKHTKALKRRLEKKKSEKIPFEELGIKTENLKNVPCLNRCGNVTSKLFFYKF